MLVDYRLGTAVVACRRFPRTLLNACVWCAPRSADVGHRHRPPGGTNILAIFCEFRAAHGFCWRIASIVGKNVAIFWWPVMLTLEKGEARRKGTAFRKGLLSKSR